MRLQRGLSSQDRYFKEYVSSENVLIIPDIITTIGENAFCNSKITTILIPSSVTHINENAFSSCENLEKIIVDKENKFYETYEGVLYKVDYLAKSIIYVPRKVKGNNGVLTIPEGVEKLQEHFLDGCENIEKLCLPVSVVSITKDAIRECINLKSIEIDSRNCVYGSNYYFIYEKNEFEGDNHYIMGGEWLISEKPVDKEKDELDVNSPSFNFSKYMADKFKDCPYKNFENPNYEKTYKTTLKLDKNVTELYNHAFAGYVNLKELEIQGNITKVGRNIFGNIAENIEKFILPNKLTNPQFFGDVFYKFTSLESLHLSEGFDFIPDYAFSSYHNLKSLYIPSTVNNIGNNILTGSYDISNIEVSNLNKVYYSRNNCIYEKKSKKCIFKPIKKQEEREFLDNSKLTSRVIPLKDGYHVLFGDWPQSLKAGNVCIDESVYYKINGYVAYKGSDDCYYTKINGSTFLYEMQLDSKACLEDGSVIKADKDYFFKIESIKWRILQNQGSKNFKFLLSDKLLIPYCYYADYLISSSDYIPFSEKDGKAIYPVSYEYSTIKSQINNISKEETLSLKSFSNSVFSSSVMGNQKPRIFLYSSSKADLIHDNLDKKEGRVNKKKREESKQNGLCMMVGLSLAF